MAWRDNIPLLSFLWLGRRARCCQAPIAWSYPLTELATGLLFILAGALLTPGLPLAGGLVLLSFLLILARIDARTQLLPDRLTLPLLWAGLLFNLNGCTLPCRMRSPGRWPVIWRCGRSTGCSAC
ncbi:prepilin peptidase [Microbacterium enclense]|uniref:prepilin peptidase n=1 Tax=Microbacterium enclense TaxID=993073 RepID=UPI003556A282